jgi:hypothetical protein
MNLPLTALLLLGLAASATADAADPALGGVVVKPEADNVPYSRTDWMPGGWADEDGDCQDQRQEILITQSKVTPVLTADGCSVVRGRWVDPYTGEATADPGDIEIDHFVALKEAHDSGGFAWLREKKQAFAQDLTSGNLFAVMTSTNRQKGDRDPGEWLPRDKARACWYVKHWVEVKRRWGLSMDQVEADSIKLLQERCP